MAFEIYKINIQHMRNNKLWEKWTAKYVSATSQI